MSREVATRIAKVEPDRILVRGDDLCADMIGKISFAQFFWRLVADAPASAQQSAMLDACLIAIAEHGLVPSVQAARMTYAAGPDAMQGAVAAGLLGCGSVILGASDVAGRMLAELVEQQRATSGTPQDLADAHVALLRETRQALPGFGHPVHRAEDPRASRLLAVADELGVAGPHVEMLKAVTAAVPAAYGRLIALNVSGAIPAVLLDAGFPLDAMKGVPLVARCVSLVAHLLEENEQSIGFALANAGEQGVAYAGPDPRRSL